MKKIIITLIFSEIYLNVFAQSKVLVIRDTIKMSATDKEVELYKLLYENTKSANASSVTMIITLISIMVAFLIFILGSQAFFNYRLNTKDLENLKSDLLLKINQESNDRITHAQTLETVLREEIEDKSTQSEQKLSRVRAGLSTSIDIIDASVSELKANHYISKGYTQSALINLINQCRAQVSADLPLSLKLSLKVLNDFITSIDNINNHSVEQIPILIQQIEAKYPNEFSEHLVKLSEEFSKKEIVG